MTYSKPTVEVLGEAAHVIEGSKPNQVKTDSPRTGILAAYDLDE